MVTKSGAQNDVLDQTVFLHRKDAVNENIENIYTEESKICVG